MGNRMDDRINEDQNPGDPTWIHIKIVKATKLLMDQLVLVQQKGVLLET